MKGEGMRMGQCSFRVARDQGVNQEAGDRIHIRD